ncbi:MAG: signal recognition particle-docking protein FtsY [Eubacteriales bacterium]|jgi:fused signal recognition particle receptor
MGFFDKLRQGLQKTRDSVLGKIDNVLRVFVRVDEELFEELEETLILGDLGVETAGEIVERLRQRVREQHINDREGIRQAIIDIMSEMLEGDCALHLDTRPSIILVIGVNGVGKTTSIAKIANLLKGQGKKVILGAADTFRAAAIDQLDIWAQRVGVDIVKHSEGSDPAAVVFDTIAAAKARGADVIICDTAGRLHNKKNLMNELGKIFKVMERELPEASREVLLVLDATTGQNAVSQAQQFKEVADITGIVLTKLDGTAKGGIVIAIRHGQGIPVKFIGVGEKMEDLQPFQPKEFARAIFGGEDFGQEQEEPQQEEEV